MNVGNPYAQRPGARRTATVAVERPRGFGAHGSNAGGFTLVEVMVALFVIAIGMLGIAKMQALALSSTGVSRGRALAAIEASSLAAAMHANRAYWASTDVAPSVTISAGGATATTADLTAALTLAAQAAYICSGGDSCLCNAGALAPCTPVNLAGNDLGSWANDVNNLLPAATATVTCNPADSPVDCTIAMSWNENAVAINAQESANTPALQTAQYALYVVP